MASYLEAERLAVSANLLSTAIKQAISHSSSLFPPWSRVEGKYLVNFQGVLPDSGSILGSVHFWEVPFALMLSPGWITV